MPTGPTAGNPPGPDGAASLDELIGRLQALRAWTGMPYRELHRRLLRRRRSQGIAEEPAYATVYRCLQPGRSRLDVDLFVDIATVLCGDEVEAARWRQVYAQLGGGRTAPAYATVFDALPEDIGEFTGREAELALVLDQVRSRQSGVLAIEGMAGVGKTSLAVHAARRCLEEGQFDVVLTVNLCGYDPERAPVEPLAALDGFLRQLGEPGPRIQALDLDGRADRYRELLADRRSLVLLDNAASEDQVRQLLPDSSTALVFVTSRHRVAPLPAAKHVALEVFSPDQAVDLLRRRVGTEVIDADPDIARRLVGQVGHLPLAVALLASRIQASHGWTLEDHLEHLTERRNALRLDTGVELAFATSYETLPPSLRRMLRLVALHPGRDCDAYAAAALAETDLDTAIRRLADLVEGSLVSERVPGRHELHDLVRIYALGRARDEDAPSARRTALTRLFDHYRWATATAMDVYAPEERGRAPSVPKSGTEVPIPGERAAAIDWLEAEWSNLIAMAANAVEYGWPDHVSDLSAVLAPYLLNTARHDDAELLHGPASRMATGDTQGVALKNLAVMRWHRGQRSEAFGLFQDALDIAQQTDDRSSQSRVLNNLGLVHHDSGRYDDAVDCYEQAQAIYRSKGDRTGESRVLFNLGITHLIMGRYTYALDHFLESLAITRANDDRANEARVLENVGRLHNRRGDYGDAVQTLQQSIAAARDAGDALAEAEAQARLGSAYAMTGELRLALQCQRSALLAVREIGSPTAEFDVLSALTNTLRLVDRPDEALAHAEDALKLATRLEDPYRIAIAHDEIAQSSVARGETHAARSHWQEALTRHRQLGTPEADNVAMYLSGTDEAPRS